VHRDACESTHVHRSQTDELLDLEMACLARRRTAFAATIDVLKTAAPDILANAQAIVADLPSVASCADASYVGARAPIEDPALAARVDAIRQDVARTHALLGAGASLEALDTATATHERAASVGHPDTLVEALHARGLALNDGGEPQAAAKVLEEGYWIAHGVGNDDMAFLLATALVETIGHELRDDAASQPWIREATALASRATIDPGRRWQLHVDVGIVHWTHARFDDAQREFDAALVALGDVDLDDPRRSKISTNLGAVALARGDLSQAQYLFMRSLTSDASRVGTEHLVVAESYGNLGVVAFQGGDPAMARAWFERAYAVRRAHLGDAHPHTLGIMGNLAAALLESGEHEAGIEMLRGQIAGWDARPGGHPNAHSARYNLAIALSELGRNVDALEPATTAALALGRQLGAAHPQAIDASELVEELLALVDADAMATVQRVRATVIDDAVLLARFDGWLAARGLRAR
jgi:tetratricopeptide (TPR) repeat protein